MNSAKILAALLLIQVCWASTAATFTASLDRSVIALGESATLSLTFAGAQPKDVPTPAPVTSLRIAYVGPSSQVTIVNSEIRSTTTYVFTVTPTEVGEFTIAAITAEAGGQKLTSQPLKLLVSKPESPPPAAVNAGTQVAFMRLLVPKTNLFLNEVTTAELQLFLNQRVRNVSGFQPTAMPAEGFTTSKLVQGQTRRAQVGTAVYTVIPFTLVLKPAKTGNLTLGPVTASVTVEVQGERSRRRDPFFEQFGFSDPFDMLSGTASRQLSLATDSVAVHSEAPPSKDVPPAFNGAVGSFTMVASSGPTNVAVGDPITIKVQIEGRGALDAITLPEQAGWQDFKVYPPTCKTETNDSLGILGSKTFEQVVVPQSVNVKALPPVTFSYFDPEAKAYRTLRQAAVPLIVRPAGATPAPTIAGAAQDNAPPKRDIVHIKQRLGHLAQVGPPLMLRPAFLVIQSLPLWLLLAVYAWRKREDLLAGNPRLRRRKQVARITREGLVQLRQFAATTQTEVFFSTLFRLLQEQLGERLDMPASAITEAVIDEKLRPQGAPETLMTSLHELFQACNLARYAPASSPGQLESLVTKVEDVLAQIAALKL